MKRLSLVAGCMLALFGFRGTADATYPGSNGMIAYVTPASGGLGDAIWAVNPDGTSQHQLVPPQGTDVFLGAWSPDGRLLTYSPRNQGVWLVNADGSNPRQVTMNRDLEPSFSPSGRRIVFTRHHRSIVSVRLDGTHQRVLVPSGPYVSRPVYSPDGKWIAYGRIVSDGGTSAIFLMHRNGSDKHRLASPNLDAPDWSPDAAHIAFYARELRIGVMGADVTHLNYLGVPDAGQPAYSPDGRWIVAPSQSQLALIRPNGTGLHYIAASGGASAWQPLP